MQLYDDDIEKVNRKSSYSQKKNENHPGLVVLARLINRYLQHGIQNGKDISHNPNQNKK